MTIEKRSLFSPAEAEVLTSEAEENARYGTISVFELKDLPESWPEKLNKAPVYFRRVSLQQAARLQDAMEKSGHYPPGDAARRMEAQRKPYIGEVESPKGRVMVTYGWVALDAEPLGNTGCSFDTPPGDAYLYDFATVPEYRGKGFYPALLRYILADLADQGIRRAWIGTAPGNDISARSILKAGFTKVADTGYIQAQPDRPAYFELVEDDTFSPELRRLASQAFVTNPA
jgi:ribosomal protein S18 acetylase RimI-like enzyme